VDDQNEGVTMHTDKELAANLHSDGYHISDAGSLQPHDIVEGILAMKRRNERRVLVLERMTAREADIRLTEARDDGWKPLRWIRIGPEKAVTAHLQVARA
jgi:precorrin-6B methylase 1